MKKVQKLFVSTILLLLLCLPASALELIFSLTPDMAFPFLTEGNQKYETIGFIRIHKSYVVNFRYIFEFQKNYVILDDHTKIPISKNRMTEIKKEYIDFTRKEIQ